MNNLSLIGKKTLCFCCIFNFSQYSASEIEESNVSQQAEDKGLYETENEETKETPSENQNSEISRLFFRDVEVLLKPKEIQLILGINYNSAEQVTALNKSHSREISLPLNVSIGLSKNLEAFISVPFIYVENEFTQFNFGQKEENANFGDVSTGFSYRFLEEKGPRPSMTSSITIKAPTDDNNDPSQLGSPTTSSGYWSLSNSFSFTHTIDPAIMFLSFGASYIYEDEKFGLNIKPGNTFFYSFGTGLSINSLLAMSGRLAGRYSEEAKINGEKLIGSSRESISFVLTSIYRVNRKLSVESFVDFGLNNDENSTSFGFNYIYNF